MLSLPENVRLSWRWVALLVGLVLLAGLYLKFILPHCLSYSDRGLCNFLVLRQRKPKIPKEEALFKPTPTPTPAPRPIPHGPQTFTVSTGKKTGPQFGSGKIDPYDPDFGFRQIYTVNMTSQKPITKATLTIKSDNKNKEIPMELKEGSDTSGTWQGIWTVDDTYLYTYNAVFTAGDGSETNSVELTLR